MLFFGSCLKANRPNVLNGQIPNQGEMKLRKLKMLAALLLTAAMLAGLAACDGKTEETIVYIGTSAATRPHTFMDDDGNLTGYDIEVMRLLEAKIPDIKFEYVITPTAEVWLGLDAGRVDIGVNNFAKNPARVEKYLFGEKGYIYVETYLVVHSNDSRTSLDQFEGAVLGGQPPGNWFTNIMIDYNEANGEPYTMQFYDDYPTLFTDIHLGRVDATINDSTIVAFNAQALGLNIKYVGEVLDSDYSYWVMRQDEKGHELKAKLDKAMDEIIADGSLLRLSMEWFDADFTKP
jgi:L-cystine transport system substrate-binding protein